MPRIFAIALLSLPLLACKTGWVDDFEPTDWEPVRFAVIGDWGEGNQDQIEVAGVMETVCADQGCDLIVSTGDNIYDEGITAADDQLMVDRWENVYADIDLPWYISLGNHDWGGLGNNEERADYQVAYQHPRWNLPTHWHDFSIQNVDFFALDTNYLLWWSLFEDEYAEQGEWLDGMMPDTNRDRWYIPFGHHPYLSNGQHGNASAYDGFDSNMQNIAGTELKNWFDDHVCGKASLYLAGHDHDRQWQENTCDGTNLVISGAGAKLRDFRVDNPLIWGDDTTEGFLWVEIDDDTATLQFWDKFGEMNYEGTMTRPDFFVPPEE